MKVALCARYSSDNQRDASIEDQLRLCRLHAEKQGWTIVDSYTDRAISGASLLRPGIQELISDARQVRRRAGRSYGPPQPRSGRHRRAIQRSFFPSCSASA